MHPLWNVRLRGFGCRVGIGSFVVERAEGGREQTPVFGGVCQRVTMLEIGATKARACELAGKHTPPRARLIRLGRRGHHSLVISRPSDPVRVST